MKGILIISTVLFNLFSKWVFLLFQKVSKLLKILAQKMKEDEGETIIMTAKMDINDMRIARFTVKYESQMIKFDLKNYHKSPNLQHNNASGLTHANLTFSYNVYTIMNWYIPGNVTSMYEFIMLLQRKSAHQEATILNVETPVTDFVPWPRRRPARMWMPVKRAASVTRASISTTLRMALGFV